MPLQVFAYFDLASSGKLAEKDFQLLVPPGPLATQRLEKVRRLEAGGTACKARFRSGRGCDSFKTELRWVADALK